MLARLFFLPLVVWPAYIHFPLVGWILFSQTCNLSCLHSSSSSSCVAGCAVAPNKDSVARKVCTNQKCTKWWVVWCVCYRLLLPIVFGSGFGRVLKASPWGNPETFWQIVTSIAAGNIALDNLDPHCISNLTQFLSKPRSFPAFGPVFTIVSDPSFYPLMHFLKPTWLKSPHCHDASGVVTDPFPSQLHMAFMSTMISGSAWWGDINKKADVGQRSWQT